MRYCPVCDHRFPAFGDFGVVKRTDALCPGCGALERHRLVWLYFEKHTELFDGRPKKMLHVAPEECFESRLRERLGEGYVTADLDDANAMVRLDLMDIDFPDDTFDVIYCSHVLEHVADDRRAIRELHRVLAPGGWAIVQIPILGETTIEDPTVNDPRERLRLFGQEDHVRLYGRDAVERLREAGFDVVTISADEIVSADEAEVMGLTESAGFIFFCTKR